LDDDKQFNQSAWSKEHFTAIVYSKFERQPECIMGNWKIENYAKPEEPWVPGQTDWSEISGNT